MEVHTVVVLVIGVATFVVAFVGLVVKLIEPGRWNARAPAGEAWKPHPWWYSQPSIPAAFFRIA